MEDTDFGRILTQLRQSPEVMTWATRREVTQLVALALADGNRSESILQLVYLLASDSKWEVRTDVADLLLLLPEDHFTRVAATLTDDTNSFVRRAAERALDRRRRGQQATRRGRQEFTQVQSQYAAMEKLHGKAVADKARKIAERLFDHMVASTVHEMRGILTPLMASTSSLLHHLDDGELDPVEFRRQLTKTADRLAFLERLVEDMRTYSQPPPNERCRERLSELVQSAATMVRENLEAHGRRPDQVMVTIDIPGALVVEVSRHLILIAIANVLKNAFEAFAGGPGIFRPGTIAVSARLTDGDAVEIVVQDNGIGIRPEDLQEIMDFVPGKTTKKSTGTGFGLPIAQRNLAAHGGSIGIKSVVDAGTTVTVILPIEQDTGTEYDLRSLGD
jgi:signal transduction histidine kinase